MSSDEKGKDLRLDEEKARIALADFVMAILLISLCLVGAYLSFRMPNPRGWYSAPALFPLLILGSLFVMALILLVGAMKTKLSYMIRSTKNIYFLGLLRTETTKRFGLITLAVFIYIYILLRFLFFEFATITFLIVTLFIFWKAKKIKMIIISIIATISISVIFSIFFKTLLPGQSFLMLLFHKIF